MKDCIFCKIANREIPTEFVHESENLVVFNDIHPNAPVHMLIVPKTHYKDIAEIPSELWIEVRETALALGEKLNLKGFRIANNAGELADIPHFHIHFMANFKKTEAYDPNKHI